MSPGAAAEEISSLDIEIQTLKVDRHGQPVTAKPRPRTDRGPDVGRGEECTGQQCPVNRGGTAEVCPFVLIVDERDFYLIIEVPVTSSINSTNVG